VSQGCLSPCTDFEFPLKRLKCHSIFQHCNFLLFHRAEFLGLPAAISLLRVPEIDPGSTPDRNREYSYCSFGKFPAAFCRPPRTYGTLWYPSWKFLVRCPLHYFFFRRLRAARRFLCCTAVLVYFCRPDRHHEFLVFFSFDISMHGVWSLRLSV